MPPAPTSTITASNGGSMIKSSDESLKMKNGKLTNGVNNKNKTLSLNEVELNDDEPLQMVWKNVALFIYLHAAALVGLYFLLSGQVMLKTFLWGFLFYCMSGFGITAGAHRYWSHKSYKAKTPLRLILMIMQTVAFQNSVYEWCRDHRVHHKFTESHADPHNARRGFFFAHIGWLMCRKHKAVKVKGKTIDMTDLEADKMVMFQDKYYIPLVLTACFFIPTLVPWYFWGEGFTISWFFSAQFRYCITLHMTWLVNSAAHLWGPKPYDKTINPAENKMVAWCAFGEGWHNYHHVFPWDYKTAELGQYQYNFTAGFIDLFARIGWAYDLKSVPKDIVLQRVSRTGDGSHLHHHDGPWGWGDVDIPKEDEEITETLYPLPKQD